MSGFRVRPVALMLGLLGAALLVAALFLWAVSRLQVHGAGLTPLNPALFIVPGVIGVVACITAVVPLVFSRAHRFVSARSAASAPPARGGSARTVEGDVGSGEQ